MGYFKKAELELFISIPSSSPHEALVYATWPYYVERIKRCEGFTVQEDWRAPEGGEALTGILDLGDYNYLWLRKSFGSEQAEEEFQARRAELPQQPARQIINYRVEPHERETCFHAEAVDPYWVRVMTDMAVWLKRLEAHPYAVCVEETRSRAEDTYCLRDYRLPRKLLTLRRARPRYSEEYREALRQRLARVRR